ITSKNKSLIIAFAIITVLSSCAFHGNGERRSSTRDNNNHSRLSRRGSATAAANDKKVRL
ncbi:unnamed protein product, partial [Heterosigma akashiwo]